MLRGLLKCGFCFALLKGGEYPEGPSPRRRARGVRVCWQTCLLASQPKVRKDHHPPTLPTYLPKLGVRREGKCGGVEEARRDMCGTRLHEACLHPRLSFFIIFHHALLPTQTALSHTTHAHRTVQVVAPHHAVVVSLSTLQRPRPLKEKGEGLCVRVAL